MGIGRGLNWGFRKRVWKMVSRDGWLEMERAEALEIGLGFRCYRLMVSAGVWVYWCHLVSVMAVHAR